MTTQDKFRELVDRERDKQRALWGEEHDARHAATDWAAILAHEVGCFADAALNDGPTEQATALVKIAAVCEAAAALYDRDPLRRTDGGTA